MIPTRIPARIRYPLRPRRVFALALISDVERVAVRLWINVMWRVSK